MTKQLFVMVKEPLPGRVKTRLGAGIGLVPAAWWFRHQVGKLIRKVAYDPRWQTTLAVSPDHAGLRSRIWPADIARWPQGRGDLGDRMARIFRHAPRGPIVIVGADIPGISSDLIAKAFTQLGEHEAVLGPAPDGGYWLIGLKRARPVPPDFLGGVRWSTEHALSDTLASLGTSDVAMIDVLTDVDTVADLQ